MKSAAVFILTVTNSSTLLTLLLTVQFLVKKIKYLFQELAISIQENYSIQVTGEKFAH